MLICLLRHPQPTHLETSWSELCGFALTSCLFYIVQPSAKNKAQRNKFPVKSRVRRARCNSAAASAAAASVVVAAVSVREMEKGSVWASLCGSEFLCTIPSEAELCCRAASCVFPSDFLVLCSERSSQKGRDAASLRLPASLKIGTQLGHRKAAWLGWKPTADTNVTDDDSPRVDCHAPQPHHSRKKHSHVKVTWLPATLGHVFQGKVWISFCV